MTTPRLTDEMRHELDLMAYDCASDAQRYRALAIRAALAEIDANRKDAERYRYIRTHGWIVQMFGGPQLQCNVPTNAGAAWQQSNIDGALDAARGDG